MPRLPPVIRRTCVTTTCSCGLRIADCAGACACESALVWHDILPLAGIRARDDRHDRVGFADIEYFVRHTRLDEDEVAGAVFDTFLQSNAVLVPNATRQDVEHHLETDMNVGACDAARRNG